MKLKIFLFLIVSTFCFQLNSQTVSNEELQKIAGHWKGQLTYTDYQDDVSQSKLGCGLKAKCRNNDCTLWFLFTEPDGRIVKDKTKIKLKRNGTTFVLGKESYKVLEFKKEKEGWNLMATTTGKDNNKTSEIKQEISSTKKNFTIKKMVKYEGSKSYFERNRYSFTREQ